jgi:AraC family transcriptional regulator
MFHLLREFNKYFNVTPHKYLTQVRLQKARKLIGETDLKLADVIAEVGFEDLASFSKLFKNYFGKSPRFFRQQQES